MAVHELFHQVQWKSQGFALVPHCIDPILLAWTTWYPRNGWFMEASAEWMGFHQADLSGVYPPNYWSNLGTYLDTYRPSSGLIRHITVAEGALAHDNVVYGEAIFARYLELEQGGASTIWTIWQNVTNVAVRINEVLGGGRALANVFSQFAASLYDDRAQDVYNRYHGSWRAADTLDVLGPHIHTLSFTSPEPDPVTGGFELKPLGAEYVEVAGNNLSPFTRLRLSAKAGTSDEQSWKIVVLKYAGGVLSAMDTLDFGDDDTIGASYDGIIEKQFENYDKIVLVFSNGSISSPGDLEYTLTLVPFDDQPPGVFILGTCHPSPKSNCKRVDVKIGLIEPGSTPTATVRVEELTRDPSSPYAITSQNVHTHTVDTSGLQPIYWVTSRRNVPVGGSILLRVLATDAAGVYLSTSTG
jgi:hypothetical protein